MALASGIPVHQISASGAIRVGSSPTLINTSFCFRMGTDHDQPRPRGDGRAWIHTIRLFEAKSRSQHAINHFVERQAMSSPFEFTHAGMTFRITAVYSHATRYDLFATVVSLVTRELQGSTAFSIIGDTGTKTTM
jgi:hypothetical protein